MAPLFRNNYFFSKPNWLKGIFLFLFFSSLNVNSQCSLNLSTNKSTFNCSTNQASGTVTVLNGTPPYTYTWLPTGGNANIATGLTPNTYTVLVQDSLGCNGIAYITINYTNATLVINQHNVSCFGGHDGTLNSNLMYAWVPTPISVTWTPPGSNAYTINNLTAGSYSLQLVDGYGCRYTANTIITEPGIFTSTVNYNPTICFGAVTNVTLNPLGGTAPYTYTWLPSGVTNSIVPNLSAGTYSAFLTDANGCKTQTAITITSNSNINTGISKNDITCNGLCNGKANVVVAGGTGPYSYNWVGIPSGSLAAVNGLCSGQYTVNIVDALGCSATNSVTIVEPPVLNLNITGNNSICFGNTTILNSTLSGGMPGYVYNWTPGNLTTPTIIISPSVTTAYQLTVTDTNACTIIKTFSLNVNSPLSISGANSFSVCPNVNTTLSVTPFGGDGNYVYNWQPGNYTTSSITVTQTSTTVYTITITDGCGTTPLSTPININVYSTQIPTFTVDVKSGCEPLCVQFSNTTPGNNSASWAFGDLSNSTQSLTVNHCYQKPGNYTIYMTTTDFNGCKTTLIDSNFITVYGTPKADFIYSPDIIDLNSPDALFKSTSLDASQFLWKLDGNLISTEPNVNHSFYNEGCYSFLLRVSNSYFCSDSTEKTLCITDGFNFYIPNAFTPDEDTKNDFFIPKGTGWIKDNYSFRITDRWGITVFNTTDMNQAWDGKMYGKQCTDDTYIWKVFLKDIYNMEHEYSGVVILIR